MNENENLLSLLDQQSERVTNSIFAIHPHAVELCKDAAARIRELEAKVASKCEFCNEPPLTQSEKDWFEENADKQL